jgi:hypothetical protein
MEENLASHFIKSHSHTTINFLQLENYDFPKILDDAIDRKQTSLQDKEKALNEREGQLTIAETKRLSSQIDADKIIIKAQAEVNSILLEANTTSNFINSKWDSRAQTFFHIKTQLNMTAPEFINEYLKNLIIKESSNIKLGFN